MENDSAEDTGSTYAPSEDDIHMLCSGIEIHQQPTLTTLERLNTASKTTAIKYDFEAPTATKRKS